jgi:hypothetical protein
MNSMSNPPAPRRMKSYTGGQGYVYQYYFVGKREALAPDEGSTEYIFDVTSDRKTLFSVSVIVPRAAITQWASSHGRSLTEAEQYAGAKLRLFQGFDEIEDMMAHGRRLVLSSEGLQELLASLGVG